MLHTTIVDNFFDNVDEIIKLSKELKYYKRTEKENWPGIRTKSLHETHYDLFHSIIVKILNNYYHPSDNMYYSNTNAVFTRLKYGDEGRTRFHLDDDVKLAAVIYLTEGDIEGGTTLFEKNNKKQIIVANTFNSMICYDGNKRHGYTSLSPFKNKERLTLNVFIGDIKKNEKIYSHNKRL